MKKRDPTRALNRPLWPKPLAPTLLEVDRTTMSTPPGARAAPSSPTYERGHQSFSHRPVFRPSH